MFTKCSLEYVMLYCWTPHASALIKKCCDHNEWSCEKRYEKFTTKVSLLSSFFREVFTSHALK